MDIYLVDYDGQEVLNPSFVQYDAGQKLRVTGLQYDTSIYTAESPVLHFWNEATDTAIAVVTTLVVGSGTAGTADAVWEAEVPNSLLESPLTITVAVYLPAETTSDPSKTVWMTQITVEKRVEPQYDLYDNEGNPVSATEIFRKLGVLPTDGSFTNYVDLFDEKIRLAGVQAQNAAASAQAADGFADDAEGFKNAASTAGATAGAAAANTVVTNAIRDWEQELDEFYGSKPIPELITCYYNTATQKMYSSKSGSTYSNEITGDAGKVYRDADTDILYFYENDQWVEWSVSGSIAYAQSRVTAINEAFSNALDGCVVRIANAPPTASSYGNETNPVITFVIGA